VDGQQLGQRLAGAHLKLMAGVPGRAERRLVDGLVPVEPAEVGAVVQPVLAAQLVGVARVFVEDVRFNHLIPAQGVGQFAVPAAVPGGQRQAVSGPDGGLDGVCGGAILVVIGLAVRFGEFDRSAVDREEAQRVGQSDRRVRLQVPPVKAVLHAQPVGDVGAEP